MSADGSRAWWLRVSMIALSASLAAIVTVPSAGAQSPAAQRCKASLTTGVGWDHVDPAFMFVSPSVRWTNCKGVIRQVVLELRKVNPDGGVGESYRRIYIPNILKKANRTESFRERVGLVTGPQAVQFNGGVTSFRSCTVLNTGDPTQVLNGMTFYTVATAFNSRGREILKASSEQVACDQRG